MSVGFSNMEVTYEHNENTFSRWLGQRPDCNGLNDDGRKGSSDSECELFPTSPPPENQNLGISLKSSNTSYHMLNNKCIEDEYYNVFHSSKHLLGVLAVGDMKKQLWSLFPRCSHHSRRQT